MVAATTTARQTSTPVALRAKRGRGENGARGLGVFGSGRVLVLCGVLVLGFQSFRLQGTLHERYNLYFADSQNEVFEDDRQTNLTKNDKIKIGMDIGKDDEDDEDEDENVDEDDDGDDDDHDSVDEDDDTVDEDDDEDENVDDDDDDDSVDDEDDDDDNADEDDDDDDDDVDDDDDDANDENEDDDDDGNVEDDDDDDDDDVPDDSEGRDASSRGGDDDDDDDDDDEVLETEDETRGWDPSLYRKIWDRIDHYDEAGRCKRYGFGYSGRDRSERRRVFYGALIADDSDEVLMASAAEMYGILDTVAFVESNTTQTRTPRTVRRGQEGSVGWQFLQSGLYGPDTRVHVDMYDDGPDEGAMYLTREHLQRDVITDRWIQNGMTTQDLGYLADTDETFSRDFLRALQICDVRQFQEPQSCRNAKILGSTLVFEGTPECITKDRRWYHPDVVMGYCIQGVGNSTGRLVALREYQDSRGRRQDESRNFDKDVHNLPLFTAPDIRQFGEGAEGPRLSGRDAYWKGLKADDTHRATAYHFHNFFETGALLRHKYKTYGHAHKEAYNWPLESLHNDLKLMVQCVRNLRPGVNDTKLRISGGFRSLKGPRPIYYQVPRHRKRRHEDVRSFVLADEEEYGSEYPPERTDEMLDDDE